MQEYDILDVLSNKKVLCLEDEEAILKNICASLELFFAEVNGVTDGYDALELKITRYLAKPYDKKSFIKALEDVALELVGRKPTLRLNDELEYDFGKKVLYINGEISHLSKSESRLLEYFLNNKNQTITYEQIFDYIWEYEQPSKEAIKTIVKELRRKLGKDVIKNLYGVGYLCEI